MAVTVRFPNGQALTYNAGWYVSWQGGRARLYDKAPDKGGDLIASLPSDAIIEWQPPCKIENPVAGLTLHTALETVRDQARQATDWRDLHLLADLKRLLVKFNARTHEWRR